MLEDYAKLFCESSTSPRAARLLSRGRPYSPATLIEYRSKITQHILTDKALCALPMDEATQSDLEAYFARLATKVGVTRTLQGTYALLRMIFKQWKQDHSGFLDPFDGMQKPTYKKIKRGALEEKELIAMFSKDGVFADPLERVVCALAFCAGLRRGEIFALKRENADIKNRIIHVVAAVKAFGSKKRVIGDPKWNKYRDVSMADVVADAILEMEKKYGEHERIAVYPDGSMPTEAWWDDHLADVFRRAKIDTKERKITPHSARHTFASALYSSGVNLKYIQEQLGHSDLAVTDLYISTPENQIDKVSKILNKKLKKKNPA